MTTTREEQITALKEIQNYIHKLVRNLPILANELRGNEKPDTAEYLQQTIQGLGWVIEVTNTIMPLLNGDKERISKTGMNEAIIELNEALQANDYVQIADALQISVMEFLNGLMEAAQQIE